MKIWIYAVLPGIGLAALLASFHLPGFRYELFPVGVLCILVVFGLHKRELWAWQWNWLVLIVVFLVLLVPLPLRQEHGNFMDFVANGVSELLAIGWTQSGESFLQLAARLVLAGLVWLLPNSLYWKKRRHLFS
jgi:hypothetical protein